MKKKFILLLALGLLATWGCGRPHGSRDMLNGDEELCPQGSDQCYLGELPKPEPHCQGEVWVCLPEGVATTGEPRCVGIGCDPSQDEELGDGYATTSEATHMADGSTDGNTEVSSSAGDDSEDSHYLDRDSAENVTNTPHTGPPWGDLFVGIGRGAAQAWEVVRTEVTGESKRRRREAQEARRVIADAQDLITEVQKIQTLAKEDLERLGRTIHELETLRRDWNSPKGRIAIHDFRNVYNQRVGEILDKVPTIDTASYRNNTASTQDKMKTYPGKDKVETALQYVDYAREELNKNSSLSDKRERLLLVDVSAATLAAASERYQDGDIAEGEVLHDIAISLVDMALSMVPVVGWSKDIAESLIGENLLTGDKLSAFERSVAVVGVLTAGVGSRLLKIGKLGKIFKSIGRRIKPTQGEAAEEAAEQGLKIIENANDAIKAIGPEKYAEVLKTPKGARPPPETYLPKEYIEKHLTEFDDGASRFMRKSDLERYGPAHLDGTSFVLPRNEADKILSSAAGDKKVLEESLGLPSGYLDDIDMVRVDVAKPRDLNLRIPSGNEAGVNSQWLPGGKLPNGNTEAVIDLGKAPVTSWQSSSLELKK